MPAERVNIHEWLNSVSSAESAAAAVASITGGTSTAAMRIKAKGYPPNSRGTIKSPATPRASPVVASSQPTPAAGPSISISTPPVVVASSQPTPGAGASNSRAISKSPAVVAPPRTSPVVASSQPTPGAGATSNQKAPIPAFRVIANGTPSNSRAISKSPAVVVPPRTSPVVASSQPTPGAGVTSNQKAPIPAFRVIANGTPSNSRSTSSSPSVSISPLPQSPVLGATVTGNPPAAATRVLAKGYPPTCRSSSISPMTISSTSPSVVSSPKISGAIAESLGMKFHPVQESAHIRERITWMPEYGFDPPSKWCLFDWLVVGARKPLEEETHFCEPDVLRDVLMMRSKTDLMDRKELVIARCRANPFEQIPSAHFRHRGAMTMANIDATFDMFTTPRDPTGTPLLLKPTDFLYFADVSFETAATEYVLWKMPKQAKATVFAIKDPSARLSPGTAKAKSDFDITTIANINSISERVRASTSGVGVHFMMADGAVSMENHESIHEMLSKRLFLCQVLIALKIVRVGGHFVVRLMDIYTPFSVGLIYLLYRCFRRLSIFKPNTGRHASSERYLICGFKRERCDDVIGYLAKVNEHMEAFSKTNESVLAVVPTGVLQTDKEFFGYIKQSNSLLGRHQVVQMLKVISFCEDPTMVEARQGELRSECLKFYRVPDTMKDASATAAELFGQKIDPMPLKEIPVPAVTKNPIRKTLCGTRNWMFCAIGSQRDDLASHPTFFVGLGGTSVYRLEGRDKWLPVSGVKLPARTLVYGELTAEHQDGQPSEKKVYTLHIIDACVLGGTRVAEKSFHERIANIETFVQFLQGSTVRAKKIYSLNSLEQFLASVKRRGGSPKGDCSPLAIPVNEAGGRSFTPGGLIFMSKINKPWSEEFSCRERLPYFYNMETQQSIFEVPKDSIATFKVTSESQMMWWWDEGVKILPDQPCPSPKMLQPTEILMYVREVQERERMSQRGHAR